MDKPTRASAPDPQQRPYLRIGLALLGLVLVLLGGAFLLDERMRPHVGVAPAPTVAATPAPQRTSVGQQGRTTYSTSVPRTTAPRRTFTAPRVHPSPPLTPQQALMQAYHRYWQHYRQALYTLDASGMRDVATGDELRDAQAEVTDLRRHNDAVRVRVTHHALIVSLKGQTATIYDEILNRSFTVDPVTKQPGQGSNRVDLEKDIYFLRKIHGVWKVTKTLRQKG